jgi:hypothetical protein
MNEKNNITSVIILFLFFIVFICAGFGTGYWFHGHVINRTYKADNGGVESNFARERELLDRSGEYQRREEARVARGADRITAERNRIERTENAIRAIRESDRRSSSLLQELEQEINVLADYFRGSCDIIYNDLNNQGSE